MKKSKFDVFVIIWSRQEFCISTRPKWRRFLGIKLWRYTPSGKRNMVECELVGSGQPISARAIQNPMDFFSMEVGCKLSLSRLMTRLKLSKRDRKQIWKRVIETVGNWEDFSDSDIRPDKKLLIGIPKDLSNRIRAKAKKAF